ncbi:MAG TPA: pyridoxal-phosphate dependent enzyme, partial [Pyrinomonadaceae bacterium]|nr:pyridoxal-phosphate dependent enzyme [Pyrinomonadaceae bacterium]
MITEEDVNIPVQSRALPRARDLESQIGNTPLLALKRVALGLPAGVAVLVKAEHLNPGGSVKDRAALSMILDGERSGRLYPGKIILDAT